MKKRYVVVSAIALLLVALFALAALATQAEIYFSSDSNGQNRVTNVQEGDQVWICVYDPDQNIDCDLRDKMAPDLKIMDPKTGAYIVWDRDPNFDPAHPTKDYLEETGADTGLFVSHRSFQIGTRESYSSSERNKFTHIVGPYTGSGAALKMTDFQWGNYLYAPKNGGKVGNNPNSANYYADTRGWFGVDGTSKLKFTAGLMPSNIGKKDGTNGVLPSQIKYGQAERAEKYLIGRFENMDTIVGMYQDPNDPTDVAVGMMKIVDTEATISWDQQIYKDPRGAATITITDPDENLDCNKVEYVPVFILVNPGSWNVQTGSRINNFCMLKRTGGVVPDDTVADAAKRDIPIRWYNIYNSGITGVSLGGNNQQETPDGAYYIQYPTTQNPDAAGNVTFFDTADPKGYCQVMFYAQETGPSTGVFQLNLNDLRTDLGFNSLDTGDVLVAYYIDPNDEDDFHLATAYIETKEQVSITSFTDATRNPKTEYWLGRDPVYTQVIDENANVDPCCPEQVVVNICDPHGEDDSEWVIADETSSNSPVFFTNAGIQLLPVWDALGVGLANSTGGYQLVLNNWKIEAFNEDTVYARYNDVYYTSDSMTKLGDSVASDIPPTISSVRVDNDVSFAQMKIGDTQVYDGSKTNMYFLDRQGNRISGYVNSDCVFVEVVDPDQNEDSYRRERIDGYWDGGQNWPFGPLPLNPWECNYKHSQTHSVNALLGDTNIFNDSPQPFDANGDNKSNDGAAKLYVLNPRSGRWAAVDLLETGVKTGDFVSVTCIDLVSQYTCVPTLGAKPGDTIIAVYQDPSNHSDSAWISIKVGVGGAVTPPSQKSSTTFADAQGNPVTQYSDTDNVYVKVKDPSHAGATQILDAVKIDDKTFDLKPLTGASNDTFITDAITMSDIGAKAGDTITATYTDPTDPTDTSSAQATVIASTLSITKFYVDPNPFSDTTTFSYDGTGVASTFSVSVYDLAGHLVWSKEAANVSEVTWDGTSNGVKLVSGPYVYVAVLTGPGENNATKTFTFKGTVGIER